MQLKHMLPAKSGSIVNLASMAGLNGIPSSATYVATKHAVSRSKYCWSFRAVAAPGRG